MEWNKKEFLITTDKSRINVEILHQFLSGTYWAENIPVQTVRKSIENSLCFSVLHQNNFIGFARVISDFATFAYLADVFIIPEYRGQGLSSWLMEIIINHPDLQGLRRFTLATRDAHGLYLKFGFTLFDKPERWMQRHNPEVYKK